MAQRIVPGGGNVDRALHTERRIGRRNIRERQMMRIVVGTETQMFFGRVSFLDSPRGGPSWAYSTFSGRLDGF